MDTADIARHLSLEPHDDEPDLTPAERFSRAQLRVEYEAWRSDNPFSDVLDWSLHLLSCNVRAWAVGNLITPDGGEQP